MNSQLSVGKVIRISLLDTLESDTADTNDWQTHMKIPSAISQNFMTITVRRHSVGLQYAEIVYSRESFADPGELRTASADILASSLIVIERPESLRGVDSGESSHCGTCVCYTYICLTERFPPERGYPFTVIKP